MDFSTRRNRWADPSHRPSIRIIGSPEMPVAYPGLLVVVGDDGTVSRSIPLASPKGMLSTPDGLMVACYSEIRLFNGDLTSSTTFLSEPWCNDLHSLRPSPNGVLVAVAGVDAAFEISPSGATTWSWWAAEHGFSTDRRGDPVTPARECDHRRFSYPVEGQSTHINAIATLNNETFLATLFQHNMLAAVDRESGDVSLLLNGLQRPHAIRVFDDGTITLANTAMGEAIVARVHDGVAEVVQRLDTGTSWLHDAYFDGEDWMFVDGANSRVVHADGKGNVLRVDTFDPDWCLYEVLPWSQAIGPGTAAEAVAYERTGNQT
jgi:hypothetical protein